jgi:hypothetical protein
LFALLLDVLRVEFVLVLMMISPVPLSRLIFFFHLGASRKKPQKAGQRLRLGARQAQGGKQAD